jgi:spermidine synthase
VSVGDGRAFVESSAETWDVVIVDAFADDVVPRTLTTQEFMHAVRAHLSPEGVIAYNVIGHVGGSRSKPFRSLRRTLANVWRHVWVFVVNEPVATEGRNLILLATDADVDTDLLRARIVSRVGGKVSVPAFDTFADDLYEKPIRRGDVPVLTDEPGKRR